MTIGQRISDLRKSFGYSQEYIAEKMNVSRQAVSKWEQDLSAPDTYNLIALAELLQVSVEYLATGKKPEEAPPEPTAAPVSPAPSPRGIRASQIVGMILLCMGLFAMILGFLFTGTLIGIGTVLILYAIPCLAIRKHLGLVLLWLTVVFLCVLITMLMPPRTIGTTPDGGVRVARSPLIDGMLIATVAVAIVATICAIVKRFRK